MFWSKNCFEWKKAVASTYTRHSTHIDSTPNIHFIKILLSFCHTVGPDPLCEHPNWPPFHLLKGFSCQGLAEVCCLQPTSQKQLLLLSSCSIVAFRFRLAYVSTCLLFVTYTCLSAYLYHKFLKGRDFVFHIPLATLLEVDVTVSNLEILVLRKIL